MSLPNLNITNRTTLGARLVLASTYFQAGTSDLIGAEGAKLQVLIKAFSANSISYAALTSANVTTKTALIALSNIQSSFLHNIASGTHLRATGW